MIVLQLLRTGVVLLQEREGALGLLAHRIPATSLDERRAAALAAGSGASVSTALTSFALAREEIAFHVHAAHIALSHAHVTAASVVCCALERRAMAIGALRRSSIVAFQQCHWGLDLLLVRRGAIRCQEGEGARGGLSHRIPHALRDERRAAALAAWSGASVSTALTSVPLTGKGVAFHVHAAHVAPRHAHVTTATVACSALERRSMAVSALRRSSAVGLHEHGTLLFWEGVTIVLQLLRTGVVLFQEGKRALGSLAHRVPATSLDETRAATLAAGSGAGVSTALPSFTLAWEEIAFYVHAAHVALSHAHVTTAAVVCCALERRAMAVGALRWR